MHASNRTGVPGPEAGETSMRGLPRAMDRSYGQEGGRVWRGALSKSWAWWSLRRGTAGGMRVGAIPGAQEACRVLPGEGEAAV